MALGPWPGFVLENSMSRTTQRVMYWITHINIGAALGIVAFLVYSSIETVLIEPHGNLVKASAMTQSQEVRK
jgi:hypothetical protein